jgi:cytochrome c oxidase subunit 2
MLDDRAARPVEGRLLGVAFLLLGALSVGYGASRSWLPELASRHGAGIDAMLRFLLAATGAMFLAGCVALGLLVWRAAGRTRVAARLASPRAERLWSLVPGALMALVAEGGVLVIALPVWSEYFGPRPPAEAVLIEVVAQQFAWNVRYPGPDGRFGATSPALVDDASNPIGLDRRDPAAQDDLTLVNELYVPVGRPVRIRLRARDMIHSFFVPHLRVKQDAVPGMTPEVRFVATRTGTFEIACAELCGLGHYRMQGFVHVVSQEEFEQWLERQRAGS